MLCLKNCFIYIFKPCNLAILASRWNSLTSSSPHAERLCVCSVAFKATGKVLRRCWHTHTHATPKHNKSPSTSSPWFRGPPSSLVTVAGRSWKRAPIKTDQSKETSLYSLLLLLPLCNKIKIKKAREKCEIKIKTQFSDICWTCVRRWSRGEAGGLYYHQFYVCCFAQL